jgi:hypothetical protein
MGSVNKEVDMSIAKECNDLDIDPCWKQYQKEIGMDVWDQNKHIQENNVTNITYLVNNKEKLDVPSLVEAFA